MLSGNYFVSAYGSTHPATQHPFVSNLQALAILPSFVLSNRLKIVLAALAWLIPIILV
jgi:hypothetical protein